MERATVPLVRMRPLRMDEERFVAIGEGLGLQGDTITTDEALALRGDVRTLVYAQPGSKLAGVLFFIDQSVGIAQQVDRIVDSNAATEWGSQFLDRFGLLPDEPEDERLRLSIETSSSVTEAVVFDDREQQRRPVKAELRSHITLNNIDVVGPRAKIRMIFKSDSRPVMVHRGLWEHIEVFDERPMVELNEIYSRLKERLSDRAGGIRRYRIVETRLAYFAGEYAGGPDVVGPSYFVEVEHQSPGGQKAEDQGPRQVVQMPAYF